MTDHAERTYPEECCGLLVGRGPVGEKVVVEVRSLENTWTPTMSSATAAVDATQDGDRAGPALSKARRYWIDPEAMLAVLRDARRRDLDIIGIYHSHPDHPSVPSECDRQLAWPGYSYVIISVQQGQSQTCQSWSLDDAHHFQAERLTIQDF
jgi:proteasome lid subunit RPN8/RPN11